LQHCVLAQNCEAIVLMGIETITFVNIILGSQYEIMTLTQSLSEIASPISAGPWIPMIPDSQQVQDLNEEWQEEDDD
jgi:hypothetical protein